jgi:hypothetical protein
VGGSVVELEKLPSCQMCENTADYDSATIFGSWAYLCEPHWEEWGMGCLGVGFGQRLVLKS